MVVSRSHDGCCYKYVNCGHPNNWEDFRTFWYRWKKHDGLSHYKCYRSIAIVYRAGLSTNAGLRLLPFYHGCMANFAPSPKDRYRNLLLFCSLFVIVLQQSNKLSTVLPKPSNEWHLIKRQ